MPDAISRAAMGALEEQLSHFQGALVVDDLSRAQTDYAMIATVASLAELCHGHSLSVYMQGSECQIVDFNAGVLANIQPVLLRKLIQQDLWESSMMDKSIRYYHLYRPQKPNPLPPEITVDWGREITEVETPKLKGKMAHRLANICETQWGLTRLTEHLLDLLKASAALDKRTVVTNLDYRYLLKALLPLSLEGLVCDKTELEAKRYLNSNALAVLTEFVTYGQFTLRQLSRDYKVSESRCYQILNKMQKDWVIVAKEPTVYAPSKELLAKLKEVGLK